MPLGCSQAGFKSYKDITLWDGIKDVCRKISVSEACAIIVHVCMYIIFSIVMMFPSQILLSDTYILHVRCIIHNVLAH